MELYPVESLAERLQKLLRVNIILTVMAVVGGFYQYFSYSSLPSDVDVKELILPSDIVTGVIGVIQIVLYLVIAYHFLKWIYHTNKNLHCLSSESMEFTPFWSIGWYFVPLANLFKPYHAMKEIWTLCCHDNGDSKTNLLTWWWSLWIISEFLGRLTLKLALKADDSVANFNASNMADVFSDVFDVPLNIVALILVTRIFTGYRHRFLQASSSAVLEPLPAES